MATWKTGLYFAIVLAICGIAAARSLAVELNAERRAAAPSTKRTADNARKALPITSKVTDDGRHEDSDEATDNRASGNSTEGSADKADGEDAKDDEGDDSEDGDDEEDSDDKDEEKPPGWLLPPEYHEWGPFTVEYVYTADTFSNVRGGIRTRDASKYRGNFDLTLNCDLDKLAGVEGGTFFVYANDGHGRGITADYVGDYQYISNIDARNMTQVSEYWWMQKFANETLTTKLGKQDANADFCTLDSTSDFINSSFGLIPNVLLPTFPDPSMGMAVFYEPQEKFWCGFGIYDGSPDGRTWGWTDWAGEGTVVVGEAALRPNFFDGLFPGAYHAGIWYHSGDFNDLLSGQPHAGNYGVYCTAEQMIWKESTVHPTKAYFDWWIA